jgi:hypothetical protein
MNAIQITGFAFLRSLRRWFDKWQRKGWSQAAHPDNAPAVAPVVPAPACPPAVAQQGEPAAPNSVQQWINSLVKPCMVVIYVDATTTQPLRIHALGNSFVRTLFAVPPYNTIENEWEVVSPQCLRRKHADLATLLSEQEACLRRFEGLLGDRYCTGDDLLKRFDQCRHYFNLAWPDAEDAHLFDTGARFQALAQLRTALAECSTILQCLTVLDSHLLTACHMLGVPLPDQCSLPRQSTPSAQAA